MAFTKNRRAGKMGGNPGLMPIDDIANEGAGGILDVEPQGDTGRLPSQEQEERGKKRRRSSRKRTSRKTT